MDTRMIWLTNKLAELKDQISKEDYINWLASTETKMLFLHLESDLEEHKNNWANLNYFDNNPKNWIAQGQCSYIIELLDVIKTLHNDEELEDDES